MEYHFEHHVVPTIPYRGLKALHRRLDQAGMFTRHREVLSDGYVLFLARAVAGKATADW
jgi:fatty acid desaturase